MTARTTSPFFTAAFGIACLTLAMITSPMAAVVIGSLDDLDEAPALGRRKRPRLLDENGVPDVGLVGLVMGLELRGQADDALVEAVAREPLDGHDDRLVHLVAHHAPDLGLALAAGGGAVGGRLGHGHRLLALSGAAGARLARRAGRLGRGGARLRHANETEAALALDREDPRDLAPRPGDAAGVVE